MFRTHALVPTPAAGRTLLQLCKHFAHKIPVEYGPSAGRAEFLWGRCDMRAEDGGLDLTCEADSETNLRRIEGVVADHLKRFLWRTPVDVVWEATR